LLDAACLEVRRRNHAIGGLVTFGVLVVEAWMQHQDDETSTAAKNSGKFANRLAGIVQVVYQVVTDHEIERAVLVWQLVDTTDIEGDGKRIGGILRSRCLDEPSAGVDACNCRTVAGQDAGEIAFTASGIKYCQACGLAYRFQHCRVS